VGDREAMRGFHVFGRWCFCGLLGAGLVVAAAPLGTGDAALTDPAQPPAPALTSFLPPHPAPKPPRPAKAKAQVGVASWYGPDKDGRLTASGAVFNAGKLTAAHRSLPFNTRVKVTNLRNGKSVDVVINDRGPGIPGRTIDLSEQAARKLGMTEKGLAPVKIVPLKGPIALQ